MESKPVPSQEKWYHDMLRYFVIPQLQQHAGLHHITFMLSGAPPQLIAGWKLFAKTAFCRCTIARMINHNFPTARPLPSTNITPTPTTFGSRVSYRTISAIKASKSARSDGQH
ncbi:hypothetical protein TNIN_301041 [Trichonephila inaurata madagascariensis]|uniref:Uncharacterized protein n=1 Tax=Trichonephila inaurata madagascariensis TaxID=2747483 RepID=A0A8X6WR06_9ARAC|nr:hypothetical protein TNIN_301041 [Trichonephila inaurata madagascariensis]